MGTIPAVTSGLVTVAEDISSDDVTLTDVDTSSTLEVTGFDPIDDGATADGGGSAGADSADGGGSQPEGSGEPNHVVSTPDETSLRTFDPEARYAIIYAGLGICGGALCGVVFTRAWGKWGEGGVTSGE